MYRPVPLKPPRASDDAVCDGVFAIEKLWLASICQPASYCSFHGFHLLHKSRVVLSVWSSADCGSADVWAASPVFKCVMPWPLCSPSVRGNLLFNAGEKTSQNYTQGQHTCTAQVSVA